VVASRVAAGGVDAVANEHFLVASVPEEYAQAVLRILDHPELRQRLGTAGRDRMLSNHAWHRSMQRLDQIIDRCQRTWNGARGEPANQAGTTR